MNEFVQQLIAGAGIGVIFGALGLALVFSYRSTGIINFGQGNLGLFGAYIAWLLIEFGIPLYLAVILALVASFVIGMVIYALTIYPIRNAPPESPIAVTIGLFMLFMGIPGLIWGYLIKPFPSLSPVDQINIGTLNISGDSLIAIVTLLIVLMVMYLLFERTRFGLAMKAVGQSPQPSYYVGIPVVRYLMFGWTIAAIVGALAAILAAPILFLQPAMMVNILVYALAAAAIGEFNKPRVVIVAGVVLGMIQAVTVSYLSQFGSELSIIVPFLFVVAVLISRARQSSGSAYTGRV